MHIDVYETLYIFWGETINHGSRELLAPNRAVSSCGSRELHFSNMTLVCNHSELLFKRASHHTQLTPAIIFQLLSWYAARASLDFWADPTICGSREP
jgi:hypothetical protein